MTNKYRHILWDWNGTLLDDVWLCIEIFNGMLIKRGMITINFEQYREMFDFPVRKCYERAGFDFSKETFDCVAAEFVNEYAGRVGECQLNDGARELLDLFADSGAQQAILSATEQTQLESMIAASGLNGVFNRIVGQSNHFANGKVQSSRDLMESLGISRHQVLLIGDTIHDYDIAEQLGIDCALVSIGHHSREKLKRKSARVFDQLSDVANLLKGEESA
ncbi:MAG: HAD family hydrolase [Calditrichaeota bacterium]|nr:HAD family hydrolase [Calditrichota bacterium]